MQRAEGRGQRTNGKGTRQSNIAKTKKQKYELERGEKFLRFTVCDYDQGSEEEQQQQASKQSGFLRKRTAAVAVMVGGGVDA